MTLRILMTAALLFTASACGDQEFGELGNSNEDVTEPSDLDIPTPANQEAADDVASQDGKARFVGLNICGFDFGW